MPGEARSEARAAAVMEANVNGAMDDTRAHYFGRGARARYPGLKALVV